MNKCSIEDLYRYVGDESLSLRVQLRYLIFTPGFQYSYFLRKAQQRRNVFILSLFWRFCMRCCMFKTGIQIPYQTRIGRGLKIGHFGNIVINPETVIGDNFNIAQGCLIGNSVGKRSGVPVIGNNVVMGANSIIVGGVKIGNDVLIAPGAFVNFDVPDNCVVIGNPGVIHKYDTSPTRKFIVYHLSDNK